MDNQSSNPDQQSDEHGAQPKPSPHQHGEGIGKEKEKTGSKQGGNEPPQAGEHKSPSGQSR
jgi:hypothetical protein